MPGTWKRANCYGYALSLDICIVPGSSNDGESPIDWSDSGTDITGSHCEKLIEACKHDGLAEADNESQFQIAVFINVYGTGLDYHFYRNDANNGTDLFAALANHQSFKSSVRTAHPTITWMHQVRR